MSAGSSASNIGYSNIAPYSSINGRYVNVDSSNSPATFGSNQVSGTPPGQIPQGLAGTKSNVDAAAGKYPGSSILFKGGSKVFKKKIKNITKQYKMKSMRRKNSLKTKIRNKYLSKRASRSFRKKTRRNFKRGQKGGYAQYQNNDPITPSYSVAGVNIPSSSLALANPPPITRLPNCVNCVDNYNHYTNTGFPSRGH
jgi:hypothetical protein